jgi:hypothetical protein
MSASIFLTQECLWPTLKELAEGCQQRKMVAVPYIGKDGAKPLKLNEGDVLICALTEANARKGLVCPDEIARLRRKGVRVYIQDHLHAKVYLIGRAAVVCSANLSQSSINNLDEAGLLITDQKVTPSIRAWFKERMGQEVTPEWLEYCKGVYKPPKIEGESSNGRKPNGVRTGTWLIRVGDEDYPEDEASAYEAGYREAKKRLSRGKVFKIEDIRWTDHSGNFPKMARRGDLIIQIYERSGGQVVVCPHGKLLGKKSLTRNGRPITYLYLEMPSKYRMINWERFRSDCEQFGLRLPQNLVSKEVTNSSKAQRIQLMASPEKLQK